MSDTLQQFAALVMVALVATAVLLRRRSARSRTSECSACAATTRTAVAGGRLPVYPVVPGGAGPARPIVSKAEAHIDKAQDEPDD